MIRRQPTSTLFPYTTLFRSQTNAGDMSPNYPNATRGPTDDEFENTRIIGQRQYDAAHALGTDRKSTRLNSSHSQISYAVFCLKKKKKTNTNLNYHNKKINEI